jgi:hypothetical protein
MELLDTTTSAIGVIYKGANRWLHNFHHPTGGGAIPDGKNLFLGKDAGNFTTGSTATSTWHSSKLVGIGYQALQANVKGFECVAIGNQALMSNLDGNRNMAIGTGALQFNTDGSSNMALGRYALLYNVTGSKNSIVGSNAAQGVSGTSIHNNTIVGYQAGFLLTNGGDRNILIGYQAGDNITSGEKNIVIGYDLNALVAASDYQLSIGGVIFGDLGATKRIGINTSTMNETLNVGGAIRLGTSALTNAGTIRWTGADFEGYMGAAWKSLTATGLWTDAGTYYRPNNVTNSGNTGVRIYDAGNTRLGQVAPTTGNNFGGGSTDGTVLKVNHGNNGSPTVSVHPPLWVKRYYNYAGATWNAGAAYFGAVKKSGQGSLHTVQIDTHCEGGDVPAAGGVLSCLLSHLKNDSCVGSAMDVHNMQIITYLPSNAYSSVCASVMVDLNNRRASEGWLDDYVDKWSCGIRVANESSAAYDNSCAYSIGSGSGGGKWYTGYQVSQIAYDGLLNKGEGIFFKTTTFDANAVCMRAEGILTLQGGNNIDSYAGTNNWFIWYNGRPNSRNKRMELTDAGNLNLDGVLGENQWSLDKLLVQDKKWSLLDSCHKAFETHDGSALHEKMQIIDKDTGKIGKRPSDIIQVLVACVKELKSGKRL